MHFFCLGSWDFFDKYGGFAVLVQLENMVELKGKTTVFEKYKITDKQSKHGHEDTYGQIESWFCETNCKGMFTNAYTLWLDTEYSWQPHKVQLWQIS